MKCLCSIPWVPVCPSHVMPVTQSKCQVAKYCDLQVKKSEVNHMASTWRIAMEDNYQVYALMYMSLQKSTQTEYSKTSQVQ